MRVIIVGAGLVGTELARILTSNKDDVVLIELNEERARHASNRLDCMVIHDDGNSLNALEEAGISKADALICSTGSDEINMIVCGIAATRNSKLLKIARVRNDEYVRFNSEPLLGVDHFVHPDIEASRTALAAVDHNAAGNIISFAGTEYELGAVEVIPGSQLDGLNLKNYRHMVPGHTLVTLIERNGRCIMPSGSTVINSGDRVHVLANNEDIDYLFTLGGQKEGLIKNIGIVGGGNIGTLIIKGLLFRNNDSTESKKKSFFSFFKGFIMKSNRKVVVIEQDYALCKELSANFPETIVLNEDISDENFIHEDEIKGLDLIVTATGNQELNIITALYLKSLGVKRAIAIVSGDGYAAIARRLGIDVAIPIKSVIIDTILSHLLGNSVRAMHSIGDGSITIFEIEVSVSAPAAGNPITDFKFSSNALIMLVERNNCSFIPRGDYVFTPGDHVVITAKKELQSEIEKFFGIHI